MTLYDQRQFFLLARCNLDFVISELHPKLPKFKNVYFIKELVKKRSMLNLNFYMVITRDALKGHTVSKNGSISFFFLFFFFLPRSYKCVH